MPSWTQLAFSSFLHWPNLSLSFNTYRELTGRKQTSAHSTHSSGETASSWTHVLLQGLQRELKHGKGEGAL